MKPLVRYYVNLHREPGDDAHVHARLTKAWWRGMGHGTETRVLADTCLATTGMEEAEILAGALRDLALMVEGGPTT